MNLITTLLPVLNLAFLSCSAIENAHKRLEKPSFQKQLKHEQNIKKIHKRFLLLQDDNEPHDSHSNGKNIITSSTQLNEHTAQKQSVFGTIKLEERQEGDAKVPRSKITSSVQSQSSSALNNGIIDVGTVKSESLPQCSGILLDPTVVLTIASCVYPNHWSAPSKILTFELNGIRTKVTKVFGSPEWISSGQRKFNLALLKLAQPMTGLKASHLTAMTWSPYALEDIGESFFGGNDDPSSCQTASKKAQQTNVIRHMDNNLITVTCQSSSSQMPGQPLYRKINGQPVIYGVYIGHCTSGSLDRQITGSCGVRISKKIFQTFCKFASTENIKLPDCDELILKTLNGEFPTLIVNSESYNAVMSSVSNSKGAVFIYHSTASTHFDSMVYDIEAIQRVKTVYDKFQMALVDIKEIPFNVSFVPYIEFRTATGKIYMVYTKKYGFKQFKDFMIRFSMTGVPPLQSTNIGSRSNLNPSERALLPSRDPLKPVNTNGVPGRKRKCDRNGYEDAPSCKCHKPYFGSGTKGNCLSRRQIVTAHCRYHVGEGAIPSGGGMTFNQVESLAANPSWCDYVFAFMANRQESEFVAGKQLTLDDCVEEIFPIVECPKVNHQHKKRHGVNQKNHSSVVNAHRRTAFLNSSTVVSHTHYDRYMGNFYNSKPPGANPMSFIHSFYIYQDWKPTAVNKFSTLFQGDRGIPEYSAYKLDHVSLGLLTTGPHHPRRAVTRAVGNTWYHDTDPTLTGEKQGTDGIYKGRGRGVGAIHKGHLNPSQINNYDLDTMILTHTYTNAYPQFAYFNSPRWYQDSEKKIYNYAKTTCYGKSANSEFYLITGVSDYENLGGGRGLAGPHAAYFWPPGDPHAIVRSHSMWTVGCCSWTNSTGHVFGNSISTWGNNVDIPGLNYVEQFTLPTLAAAIYPGNPGFKFFPDHPECNLARSHEII